MKSPGHRPFALIRTLDQWCRCAHQDTALDLLSGTIELARLPEARVCDRVVALPPMASMAFDRQCRLFRSVPEDGQVIVHRWRPTTVAESQPTQAARPLFAPESVVLVGEFVADGPRIGPLRQPTGLAIDERDRLYVWESGSGSLLVWDLQDQRLRSRTALGFRGPVDLAWIGGRLLGVGPDVPGILELGHDGRVRLQASEHLDGHPARIAGDGRGRAWALLNAGTASARVVAVTDGRCIAVAGASDLAFLSGSDAAEVLVVARGPGDERSAPDFLRITITAEGTSTDVLAARGYDGRGIVRAPDDRVVYFGSRGLRHAVAARPRYPKRGRVTSFRLDSGEFHTRWGRIFIDACVPRRTALRVHAITCDDPPGPATGDWPIPRTPPSHAEWFELEQDGEPPLPPAHLVPKCIDGELVERSNGCELPWVVHPPDVGPPFSTWEAPVAAPPGRYLWLFVELSGDGRHTPRVRAIRVERAGHSLLQSLPRVYSRDPAAADFLWRFLALFDGAQYDLELRTALRHAIVDPRSTPEAFLPWLAGLLGLALDRRWPVARRRRVIAEATWLFRFRGTVPGLGRLLELYLDIPIQIVEHFRVRGLGGAIVGAGGAGEPTMSGSILGGGFRVGGAIGSEDLADVTSGRALAELGADGFTTHAHRFTVIVPARLTREQREVVELILDQHRPAHTLYELCTLDAGLRVGVGLYAGLSTLVGVGAGFTQLQVGASALGRDRVVGRPAIGTVVDNARLGKDSQVG